MTQQEINQIKDLISGSNTGILSRIESSYTVIDTKLDAINEHLSRLNGQVIKHQKEIDDIKSLRDKKYQELEIKEEVRGVTCPQLPRIEKIEKENLESSVTKKFVVKTVAIGMALPAAIWALVQIIGKFL